MCPHSPLCPDADAPDREAARVVASHPEQGWSRLCNGVILFEDTGELLPDCSVVAPHRGKPDWGRHGEHPVGAHCDAHPEIGVPAQADHRVRLVPSAA